MRARLELVRVLPPVFSTFAGGSLEAFVAARVAEDAALVAEEDVPDPRRTALHRTMLQCRRIKLAPGGEFDGTPDAVFDHPELSRERARLGWIRL